MARKTLENEAAEPQKAKTLVGCMNVGQARNIGGCVVPNGATIRCHDGLVVIERGKGPGEPDTITDAGAVRPIGRGFAASPAEVERYCRDWPTDFEPLYE